MKRQCRLLSIMGTALAAISADAGGAFGLIPRALTDQDFFDQGVADPSKVQLGEALFWDKELSGNRNIACATCHHTLTGTTDGLALPIGEGGKGLGMARNTGEGEAAVTERVPRNAPALFNLGALEFRVLFHDGRLSEDPEHPSGFQSPAGLDLPSGLENVLAAQAMFPVTSGTEMAGQPGENPIADAAAIGNLAGPGGVWEQLADRLRAIPEYVDLFAAAYPDVTGPGDITFVHAANAIAAYEASAFRADDSPFDRFLRGERGAMSFQALRGMRLFYARHSCAECHAGPLQTDHRFRSIALPQIGPGKGDGPSGLDDFGREQVSGHPADRYRFRTPSLRNVTLTGPWGHNGAYDDLRAVVEHHLAPVESLYGYASEQAALPPGPAFEHSDFAIMSDPLSLADIAASSDLNMRRFDERDVEDILAFLHALTDESSLDLRARTPMSVPSALPLAD